MFTKTLVSLASIGLVCSLAACGGSPGDDMSPSVSAPAEQPSTASDPSAVPSSETSGTPGDPIDSMSPSSEPAGSEDSSSANEIPSMIQGQWITFGEGETPRECTEELDAEGAIITIDSTKISSFAFYFEIEEVEENSANLFQGVFEYFDDGDVRMTPTIRLETQDDWETLALIEIGTEQAPALYARCS